MLINSLFTLISPPAINNELECIVQLLQGPLTQTLKMGDWCYHKSVFDLKTVEKHVYPSNPKYGHGAHVYTSTDFIWFVASFVKCVVCNPSAISL